MDVESGDIEVFKTQVREHMEIELERALKLKMKTQVFDCLIEANSFDIPEQLVEREIQNMFKQINPNSDETSLKNADVPEAMKKDAKHRVQLGLIVGEIVKKYEMKPDSARVRTYIEDMAKSYQHPEEMLSWYYGDKERIASIESIILEEQVVETVLEEANKSDKKLSYDEVMNPKEG